MRVFALKYSPQNSHILITGGWDNHLKVRCRRSTVLIIFCHVFYLAEIKEIYLIISLSFFSYAALISISGQVASKLHQ